ncbi:MAG TPA: hypothetical protein VER11_17985 [Polyangiaceae bacterium]|nr:hypothetical protein [Polyangiaceae bacterium]
MENHTVVWIDHKEARVMRVHDEVLDKSTVWAPTHHLHRHARGSGEPAEYPDDAKRFFHALASVLTDAGSILVVGPSTAKLEFLKYVHSQAPALVPQIVGVETVDHPSDGQIVSYAKKYFKAHDGASHHARVLD